MMDKCLWPAGILFLFPMILFGDAAKIAPDLGGADPQSIISVIVQFSGPPDGTTDGIVRQLGGQEEADLPLIQGKLISIPARALTGLANNPNVKYISPDRPVQATLDYANITVNAEDALPYGWDGT